MWARRTSSSIIGAERFFGAEKDGRKIAVEVKSFLGGSEVRELEITLGQVVLYGDALARLEPDRSLYVAVREQVFHQLFEEPMRQMVRTNGRLRLVVFDPDRRAVVRWTP